jgi:hypothetical protein
VCRLQPSWLLIAGRDWRESRAHGPACAASAGLFDIPVDHLYSLPVLIKYLRQRAPGKTVVVSPISVVWPRRMQVHWGKSRNRGRNGSATETEALY